MVFFVIFASFVVFLPRPWPVSVEQSSYFGTMVVSFFAAPGALVRYFAAERTI
jgi:hypothetical protein